MSRTGNILTVRREFGANKQARAQATAFGDTQVFGDNMVNAFRVTWNRTSNHLNDPPDEFFDAQDLGIKLYSYVPGVIGLNVTNGFTVSGGNSVKVRVESQAYQVANDLSIVRGRHQMSFGGNASYWEVDSEDNARAAGDFNFNGQATGIGLADFLTGQTSLVRHGAPGVLLSDQWYFGLYGQDSWRATDRITFNGGVRWEPFFGANSKNGAISNFVLDNFRKGITTTRFINAPAGLIYPGDPGFPDGTSGLNTQWRNFSPRVGVAWDVAGDGRTAVRSSYGLNYDFPSSVFLYIAASASPFANRVELSGVPFEDPYRNVGGDTHPLSPNPPFDAQYPAVRRVWRDGPGHQFHPRAVVECHGRTADRRGMAGLGQLSRELRRSHVGSGAHQPRQLHGSGPLRHPGRFVSVVHRDRQRRSPAHVVSREPDGGAVARPGRGV